MGLLSRISAGIETPAEIPLSFFDLANKYSLPHVCVFRKSGNFFVASASKGLDGDTILQSLSTSDFWGGTVTDNTWSTFSREDNNLNTILQFFSEKMKSEINFAQVFKNGNRILLLAFNDAPLDYTLLTTISQEFIKSDEFVKKTYKSENSESTVNVHFNVIEALNGLMQQLNGEIRTFVENAVYTETCFTLENLLDAPNSLTVSENKEFTVFVNTPSKLTEETLKAFIVSVLKPLYKENAGMICYAEAN